MRPAFYLFSWLFQLGSLRNWFTNLLCVLDIQNCECLIEFRSQKRRTSNKSFKSMFKVTEKELLSYFNCE